MTGKANLAASVLARLLNRAREAGDDYQNLLTTYCLERFLYRLSVSDCRERFVLKGAMLLRLWSDRPYRATRDLDLLRCGDGAFDAIRDDLRAIVATPVPPDGVTFDGERTEIRAIRAEDEYAGTRATMPARCDRARISVQIDMGLGDAVWPAPQACTYPTLFDSPAPELLAYPREAGEDRVAVRAIGARRCTPQRDGDVVNVLRPSRAPASRARIARRRVPGPRGTPVTHRNAPQHGTSGLELLS